MRLLSAENRWKAVLSASHVTLSGTKYSFCVVVAVSLLTLQSLWLYREIIVENEERRWGLGPRVGEHVYPTILSMLSTT